jgi:arsenate reductase
MSITIYGIKNCDTMKKAFNWLDEHNVTYNFHNYKTDGITPEKIDGWLKQEKAEVLVNNKGTTFRNFSEAQKTDYKSLETAREMMLANQSVIKRPIIEKDGKIVAVGFKAEIYQEIF